MRLLTSSPTNEWRRCDVDNQFFRQLPKFCIGFLLTRVFPDAENPRQHADDIAVEDGRRLIERNAANGAGGVTSDSRQREHVVKIIRKFAGDDVLVSP